MKKILLFILAIALCFPLLSACEGIGDGLSENGGDGKKFDFFYEIESTSYLRGDTVNINASVKNISGEDMTYTAVLDSYYPEIELYCMSEDGSIAATLKYEPVDTISGFGEMTVKDGQIGSKLYTFVIPRDAPLGTYAVKLIYRGESREFRDVLMILDETSQNENDEYSYSPVSVSAGGESVKPIRAGTSTHVVKNGDTYMLGCDGLGVWLYFGKEDTDLSTFPLLVRDGNIELELPDCTKIESIMIYDLQCNQIGGYYSSISGVNALPAGEYVIVLNTVYDTRTLSQTDYETTHYDDFFRLSVPNLTESGYETTVKMLQYDWSGAGISTKTISTCDLAYSIIDVLDAMSDTCDRVEKISDEEFDEYMYELPVERGTMWLEVGSKIYRINSERNEICRVETHLGEGVVLGAQSEFFDLVYDAWYYYPYDYYSGSYNNSTGEIELNNVFEADSTVEVNIKKLEVEKEFNSVNTVTFELISSVDQKVSIRLDSAASDDNLAPGDYKELTLKKDKTETIELSFGGWSYTYWITITVDNTRINLRIEP